MVKILSSEGKIIILFNNHRKAPKKDKLDLETLFWLCSDAIFEAAKICSLFAFTVDLDCTLELAFSKIRNDHLQVCEISRIVVDCVEKACFVYN